MSAVLAASVGLVIGGSLGAMLGAAGVVMAERLRRPRHELPFRSLLLMLLVELRAGNSILSALQTVAGAHPDHLALVLPVRVATVSGLTAAVGEAKGQIGALLSQLARCHHSGSPAVSAVRSLLEADIEDERSRRIERARRLPVRLMVPMSLMVLPGLVLMLYAPALLRLLDDLTGPLL